MNPGLFTTGPGLRVSVLGFAFIHFLLFFLHGAAAKEECNPTQVFVAFVSFYDSTTGKCRYCPWTNDTIDSKSPYQRVPTQSLFASARIANLECLRVIRDSKLTDIDARLADGLTLLMAAAQAGTVTTMNYLIQNKVDIEAKSASGETALTIAAYNGQARAAAVLLEAKAAICQTTISPIERGCAVLVLAKNCVETADLLKNALPHSPTQPGYYWPEGALTCADVKRCEMGYACPGYREKTNERVTCPENSVPNIDRTHCDNLRMPLGAVIGLSVGIGVAAIGGAVALFIVLRHRKQKQTDVAYTAISIDSDGSRPDLSDL